LTFYAVALPVLKRKRQYYLRNDQSLLQIVWRCCSYSDLASLTGLNKGDIYRVSSEGLLYTYLDNQFQQQGQGQSQELLKCKNLVLSNISINKIQTTVNGEGVRVQGEAFCSHDDITLSDIYIGNSQSTGVLATYSNRITVNNLKIDKINTSRGMQFTLCNDIHVQGGYISNIGNYGAGFTDCKDVLINGLQITNPGVSAFYFNNTTDAVKIIGCTTKDIRSPKLMTNSVIVESNLPARNPKYIIADNDFEDAVGNKITIQNGVLQDRMKISNNVGV